MKKYYLIYYIKELDPEGAGETNICEDGICATLDIALNELCFWTDYDRKNYYVMLEEYLFDDEVEELRKDIERRSYT